MGWLGKDKLRAFPLSRGKSKHSRVQQQPYRRIGKVAQRIEDALQKTRDFLGVRSETDWTRCFYQYANRLAHLYFLKEVNGINAALVFVYFVGDDTVLGREPVSHEGWEAAIDLATQHLGLGTNSEWMRSNVADVFIDVNDLRHVPWPQCH